MLRFPRSRTGADLVPDVASYVLSPRAASPTNRPARAPSAWIWRIDLANDRCLESVAVTHLLERERQRASSGTRAVRRRRILLRAGLRQALGGLLDLPPSEVPLVERDGRPLVVTDRSLHVSCSASGVVGLIAIVAGSEVGVDVEEHLDGNARTAAAEGWLAPAEQVRLRRLRSAERPFALTRCWTQKEAVLKGMGTGLRQRPDTVVTPVTQAGRIGDWAVRPVPVPPGYAAALAVRTPQDVGLVVLDMTVGEIR